MLAFIVQPAYASFYNDTYAGVKVGYTNYLGDACDVNNITCDKDDLAYGFYVGRYFKDWLALEVAYNKLGSTYVSNYHGRANFTATDVNQIDIAPRFDFALSDNWLFFTKVGLSYIDINTQGLAFSEGDSKWAPSFSIGSEYQMTSDWRLRLDLSTTTQQDTSYFNDVDPLFFGIGLTYRPRLATLPAISQVEEVKPVVDSTEVVDDIPFQQRIYFDHGSSKVNSKAVLDKLHADLKSENIKAVSLVGRTDSTGSAAYNKAFGLARAELIKAELVQEGIPASDIDVQSLGEANPIASNETKEGRALNRFVEIQEQVIE